MPLPRYFIRGALALAAVVLIVAMLGAAGPGAAASGTATTNAAQQTAQPAPSAADYVGEDTCRTCHDTQSYQGTPHAQKFNPRTPASTHGCESCHGPGKAHVDGGGDKTKIQNPKTMTPKAVSTLCTTCHDRGTHALWNGSQHEQRNLTCTTCHSVHSPVGPKQIKARSQFELCGTCHKQIVNKQMRFNHMPLREDQEKMACSSCHNVHGSSNARLLRVGTSIDESCTSCHAEKRGPFLWEHAPVAESCATCHDPHGSNNNRLLVAKVPFLCQRCHVTSRHPPTVYDNFLLNNSSNANKLHGRGCVVCHQQIHGSNSPNGQRFLR